MNEKPTLAIVGGTGLNELVETTEYLEIETPYGTPAAAIQVIETETVRILFLPRHGAPHRFPPHKVNYRANLWALRQAGAHRVLAVCAVGGLCEPYAPASLAAPDQLVDYTWGREHTIHDSDNVPLVHVDFTNPYAGALRDDLIAAAKSSGTELIDGGCIAVFQGPRLETAAEIRRALVDGCQMAGMTSLPEASLAREFGLDYAGIAVVSNWGAGVAGDHISEEDIADTLVEPMGRVRVLLKALLNRLGEK